MFGYFASLRLSTGYLPFVPGISLFGEHTLAAPHLCKAAHTFLSSTQNPSMVKRTTKETEYNKSERCSKQANRKASKETTTSSLDIFRCLVCCWFWGEGK
jgi:hypothetical protein